MTRRLTPSRALAAYLTARDNADRLKSAAAEALAVAASAHNGWIWSACAPSDGVAAVGPHGRRVGWTDLSGSPTVNASVRVGDVFVSVRGPDVPTALDALALAVARVTA